VNQTEIILRPSIPSQAMCHQPAIVQLLTIGFFIRKRPYISGCYLLYHRLSGRQFLCLLALMLQITGMNYSLHAQARRLLNL
jgi:hypothetical protein